MLSGVIRCGGSHADYRFRTVIVLESVEREEGGESAQCGPVVSSACGTIGGQARGCGWAAIVGCILEIAGEISVLSLPVARVRGVTPYFLGEMISKRRGEGLVVSGNGKDGWRFECRGELCAHFLRPHVHV